MANVIFPIISVYLTVGRTIDIKTYDFGIPSLPIYNETDVVENPLNSFNASYYVLPDENVPGEKARVPIDFLLRTKAEGNMSSKKHMLHGYRILSSNYPDNALILVVEEYQTGEQTVKANTNPTLGWQDNIWTSVPQTHYVEKIVYGYQAISLISLRSRMKGDIQVFRRIIRDTMGTSGRVTADTVELWKKVERTIRESPDVRGEVYMDASTDSTTRYSMPSGEIEDMLRQASEFPKDVDNAPDDRYVKTPLYVSCKLLHDLDEQYPIVQKDVESEKYLVKLYHLLGDVEATKSESSFVLRLLSRENKKKLQDFKRTLRNVHYELIRAYADNLSLYEYVDKEAIQKAFDLYQQGLDNTTESYLAQFRKTREKIATCIACGEDFYPPTSGALRVADNEVFEKGKVEDFEICKNFCVEDELCRAVGYSENECLIYYRSTNSATITPPGGDSEDMKIYDRKCIFRYREDDDY